MKRLLHIGHNCVMRSNQERLVEIARLGNFNVTMLTPRWNLESNGIVQLERKYHEEIEIVVGRPLLSMFLGQRYLQFHPFLGNLIRRIRPDVISAHEEPWSLTAYQIALCRNMYCPNTPLIVETEQNISKVFPPPFRWFESTVLKNSAAVVARNEEAERVILNKGFKGITRILSNGLDTNIFSEQDAAELRKRLGLTNFVAGYAGRFEKEKGLDDLLRAVASLPTPIDILLVGYGREENNIKSLANELGLKGRLFIVPPVDQELLPRYLCCMDVHVLPSRTTPTWKEQFGRVLVESMACGVPVIGSTSGAIPEVIGDAGLTFPEGDFKALADALKRLMEKKELRETFIGNGLKNAADKYSWKAVARHLNDLYMGLVT